MEQIQNPADRAMGNMNKAAGTYGAMMPNIPKPGKPEPTVGGAAMSGMGGAVAGAQIGTMISAGAMAVPYGAAAGAIIGIGSYLLS